MFARSYATSAQKPAMSVTNRSPSAPSRCSTDRRPARAPTILSCAPSPSAHTIRLPASAASDRSGPRATSRASPGAAPNNATNNVSTARFTRTTTRRRHASYDGSGVATVVATARESASAQHADAGQGAARRRAGARRSAQLLARGARIRRLDVFLTRLFIRASLEAGRCETTQGLQGGHRMKLHANAVTCPNSRKLLVGRVLNGTAARDVGTRFSGAASGRSASGWGAFATRARPGLMDRSSAPRRRPGRTAPEREAAIEASRGGCG